ncbi:MAG: gliding motility-associated C-terminal domain-containing protein [Saprospiraceae bacterium]|nr:gliding motility-associated C-terminal domain-containing protein [Saprospiraceae bacterium]MBK7796362.1 gliding motility-associated C-terminal domain-containing protein [Saprospiraceae bacterium]MBL0260252.1 gliding motility-associated C-terminal domain-containing protein [Saprospiraceae bacterium]
MMFKTFSKAFFLTVVAMQWVWAQPLQFVDAYKDSLSVTDAHIGATSDAGWMQVFVTRDSAITFAKFDFCGKLEWSRKFKLSGLLNESSLFMADDVAHMSGVLRDTVGMSILCMDVNKDGSSLIRKRMHFQQMPFVSNPKVIVQDHNHFLGFNGGNNQQDASFCFLKALPDYTVQQLLKLDSSLQMQDINYSKAGRWLVTLGDSLYMQMNENAEVDFVHSFQTRFSGMQNNIVIHTSPNEPVALSGWVENNGQRYFRFLRVSDGGELDVASSLVQYFPDIKPYSFYGRDGKYYTTFSDTLTLGRNAKASIASFWGDLQQDAIKSNSLFDKTLKLTNYKVTPTLERVFAAVLAVDSFNMLFNVKLSKFMDFSCQDSTKRNFWPAQLMKTDTFDHPTFSKTPFPKLDSYERLVLDTFQMERLCEKFDLKSGEIPYPPGCKGDSITFNVPNTENTTFNWETGSTQSSIKVRIPSSVTVTITYCGMTITQKHFVEEFSPVLPDIEYPVSCKAQPVIFQALSYPKSSFVWSSGEATDTLHVLAPDSRTVNYTCFETHFSQKHKVEVFQTQLPEVNYGLKCKGESEVFKATTFPNTSFVWSTGEKTDTLRVKAPATRTVDYTCFESKFSQMHIVRELNPQLPTIYYDPLCCTESMNFTAQYISGIDSLLSYKWKTNNSADTLSFLQVKSPASVQLEYKCLESIFTQQHILNKKDCFPIIKMPNVVAPYSEIPENRIFKVTSDSLQQIKSFQMEIYNRWGQRVYSSDNINEGWDLIFKGTVSPLETYIYSIEAEDIFCDRKNISGSFSIIK